MNVIWRTSRVLKIWFYDDLHLSVAIRYIVLFWSFMEKDRWVWEKKSCVIIIVNLKNLLLWSVLISVHYYSNVWDLEKKGINVIKERLVSDLIISK